MTKTDLEVLLIQTAGDCEGAAERNGKAAALQLAEHRLGFGMVKDIALNGTAVARRRALYLLSLWDEECAFEPLAKALLEDASAIVRHEAAFFLGALKSRSAIPPLVTALLKDQNELVRHEAAEALWDMGFAEGVAVLSQAACDPSATVRETVSMALAELSRLEAAK